MNFLSLDPDSIVRPEEMVRAFVHPRDTILEELALEPLALLTFTPLDLRLLTEGNTRVKRISAWRRRNRRIYRGDRWIAVQSSFGAPSTVMLLEELIAFGVKRVVCIGYCGSLQERIEIGGLILPTEALREEGTSYHYLQEDEKSLPDNSLQRNLFAWMQELHLMPHLGKVWTTDAPYRETPQKIDQYRAEGVLGVEMEMSAAFAVARVREISLGSVLLVSDELREAGWRTGFFSSILKATRKKMIEGLLSHLEEMIPR